MKEKVKSGMLGLAVADALGVPVEFMTRQELKEKPVTTLLEDGTYHQPLGTWSDDTSLALCMLDSLKDGLDYNDMMKKMANFLDKGDYTPYGAVFDVGRTTEQAIANYKHGKSPLECGGKESHENGNGSLMRILPMAYYIVGRYGYDADDVTILDLVHDASSLTHHHVRSQIACGIYTMIAIRLLQEGNLQYAIHSGIARAMSFYRNNLYTKEEVKCYHRLAEEGFKDLDESEIKSSGYVVDTLEAAIWCLLTTNTYKDCVLKAVNLGEDTDTVASVAGGLAGIAYGIRGIPKEWLEHTAKVDYIEQLCFAFSESMYKESARLLCAYQEQMDVFLEKVRSTCYWTTHYVTILKEHDIKISDDLTFIIERADPFLLGAILTAYIRQERFNDGLIASAIQNKVFLKIIKRLEEFSAS